MNLMKLFVIEYGGRRIASIVTELLSLGIYYY